MKLLDLIEEIETLARPADMDPERNIASICHDSRRADRNCIFVCIKGAVDDGHLYARSAYDRGCRTFVAERELPELEADATVFLVPDTRVALAQLSARFFGYPSRELFVIGITGTKGKTTTALMIYHILNACGLPCGYIGSNGIDYGDFHGDTPNTTPESYALQMFMREMAAVGVRYLVMEVSSQALYQHRVHGIDFDLCLFTNLSEDHIGGHEHPDFDHYKNCKKTLFSDYGAKKLIYNADDPFGLEMMSAAPADAQIRSYATDAAADYRATEATLFRRPDCLGVTFRYLCGGIDREATLKIPGKFNVYNALAAIAVCRECGLSHERILQAMPDIYIKGRFELVQALPYATFIIDYAHNRVSLTSALETLRLYEPKRLICLFGSVGGRTQGRRAELGSVGAALADLCILTSDNPDAEDPEKIIDDIASQFTTGSCPYIRIPDRAEALRYAISIAREGDVFLLAGKGHETYQLIFGQKLPFSERAILTEAAECLI